MSKSECTFAVLSYAPDPVSGEALNVGVVVTSPATAFADVRWEERTQRLSDAFQSFSSRVHREARRDFLAALKVHAYPYRQHRLFDEVTDAATLVRAIWPDGGLSYRVGKTGTAINADPEALLEYLFARYVTDQHPEKRLAQGATDEQVWRSFQTKAPILRRLDLAHEAFRVQVPGAPLEFPYAVRNGAWHLLQPLSFDLARAESIRDKAAKWAGYGAMIAAHADVSQLVFLLGSPGNEFHFKAFLEAKKFLTQLNLVSIIDDADPNTIESQVEAFVKKAKLPLLTSLS